LKAARHILASSAETKRGLPWVKLHLPTGTVADTAAAAAAGSATSESVPSKALYAAAAVEIKSKR